MTRQRTNRLHIRHRDAVTSANDCYCNPSEGQNSARIGKRRGIRARVYVHEGTTAVMIHRDGDTEATIDEALEEGPEIVGEMAAEIADERGSPGDWLPRLGDDSGPNPQGRLAMVRERAIFAVVKTATRIATRCVEAVCPPIATRIRKCLALTGIRSVSCIVTAVRRLPSTGMHCRDGRRV